MKTAGDSDKIQTQSNEITKKTEEGKHTEEDNANNVSSKSSSKKKSEEKYDGYYSEYNYDHDESDPIEYNEDDDVLVLIQENDNRKSATLASVSAP